MIRNVARNVWQISGFPPNAINCYLVEDVLIDAGTRWDTRRMLKAMQGIYPRLVALTHCHPDHQGAASAICEKYRCPLACHEADRPAMEGREPMGPPTAPIRLASRFFAGPRRKVDRILREGDEVAGFRVIETPGHTLGHLAYFREEDRLAIAGDLALNMNLFTMIPGLHQPPGFFCVDSSMNRRSLKKLADLRPRTVLFGHGPPLRDPEALQRFAESLP